MPKVLLKLHKNVMNNEKKPKKANECNEKECDQRLKAIQEAIDGIRDKITEDEGLFELMQDMIDITPKEMAEQHEAIIKGYKELAKLSKEKKKLEQRFKLLAVPTAIRNSFIPEDDDVIIIDVIDLTKEDN